MAEVLGATRQAVLARELTKRYEEFSRGSLDELATWFANHEARGEFVILVAGNNHPEQETTDQEQLPLKVQVDRAIASGLTTNAAIKLVAKKNNIKRQELYRKYHGLED